VQAIEGYFEDGRFFAMGQALQISGRWRAFITILDEPPHDATAVDRLAALAEFDRLVDESANEELREEDFPRMRFGREFVAFNDEE
jgi:hypothetical protein